MKIMKKSFSFVCCLFLAVSCFASCAFAKLPEDGEKIYLTPMSQPEFMLIPESTLTITDYEYMTHVNEISDGTKTIADKTMKSAALWVAHKVSDDIYVLQYHCGFLGSLILGASVSPSAMALDEDVASGQVNVWSMHGEENQQWKFEYYRYNYYRIRNVATGRYLTYDPKGVVAWDFVDESSSIFRDQLWCKH